MKNGCVYVCFVFVLGGRGEGCPFIAVAPLLHGSEVTAFDRT